MPLTMSAVYRQGGALMLEILVTLAVVVTGFLGMLELQARLQATEMETYQRTQALLLLDDMAHRVMGNRGMASAYITDAIRGVGAGACGDPGSEPDLASRDQAQWCLALQGAAETRGVHRVGTLLAGRGCVQRMDAGAVEEYLLTVAWQGATPVAAPPAGISCGRQLYDLPAGSECARKGDACRRYVSTIVHVADLRDG